MTPLIRNKEDRERVRRWLIAIGGHRSEYVAKWLAEHTLCGPEPKKPAKKRAKR